MKINKERRKRKAKRRPLAVCFNSCLWCILLDGCMLMGIRQTGSGSPFWCCGYFPNSLNKHYSFFLPCSIPRFYLTFLKLPFKERKGRTKTRRRIQGQCKCLRLVNGESRANVSKQTTAVTHSHGEMHINTRGQGGGKRQWQKRK